MRSKGVIFAFVLIGTVAYSYGCRSKFEIQPFDKAKWNEGRQNHPDLNVSPWMVQDLMTNRLSLGMPLEVVTNLLGPTESRSGGRVRGAFIEQTVYVYRPGMHNGWMVQDTNLILYFGRNGQYLREWFPIGPVVQPVNAVESEAAREATASGRLHIGNRRFAGTPSQFEALLGPPDRKRTEHQLDYFLGRRSRLAWDEVFLELHFNESNRLSRMDWLEH